MLVFDELRTGQPSGTLTLIEILDGTTLLTSFTPLPGTTSYTSPTYAWTTATLGSHTLIVKATNSQGTTTSVPTNVQVFVPPTITFTTSGNFFFTPATIELTSVVTPAPATSISRVEFFAHNGVTNTKINSDLFAPYGFSWINVAAGNYVLTAVVSDSHGLYITSAPVNVTVVNNVSIQIATPLTGSTVSGDTVLVTGTAITPSNSAVTINGQLATLSANGQFFINDLPLTAGANTITATVTAPDGQTANQVITVNRSTTVPLFEVTVGQGGIVIPGTPIVVDVTIGSAANTPFGEIAIQCAYPGPAVFALTLGTYQCTYADPGTYDVKVTVKDSVNVGIYTTTKRVTIEAPKDRFSLLTGIYNGVNTRLKAGNIDGAMNNFTNTIRENYRAAFTAAGAGLGAMVDGFGTIRSLRLNGGFAELIVVRNTVDGEVVFSVFLLQDSDGIWRIDGF